MKRLIKLVITFFLAITVSGSLFVGPAAAVVQNQDPAPETNELASLVLLDSGSSIESLQTVLPTAFTPTVESFAVMGDMGLKVGDTVSEKHLKKVGIDSKTIHKILGNQASSATTSTTGFEAVTAGVTIRPTMANAPVLYSWTEKYGKNVTLRKNIAEKLETKHNLTWRAARATTKYPKVRYWVSGTKYHYETPVDKIECKGWLAWRKCKVVDTATVLAGVDFRNNTSDKKVFGVVTTYCLGYYYKCPNFVRNALNI